MKYRLDLAILSLLFFMWGFVTCLNDILIPHLKDSFELSYFEAALVQFTFFAAYFALAIPSGRVVDRIGYKATMIVGLLVAALGAVGFVPAAKLASYPFFLGALFLLACGITLLQVSANPYVSAVGDESTAASRLNLTQAFNSLGTTVAPIIGGILILSTTVGVESVILPYIGLTLVLLLLAIGLRAYPLPRLANVEGAGSSGGLSEVLHYRHTLLGAVAIFLYVGAEVTIGSFLVNYLGEGSVLGISHETAAKYISLYWGGAMVGRFAGAALLQKFEAPKLLGAFSLLAALLVGISVLTDGWTAAATILSVGLFNSIMFPTIFALGIAKLGRLTSAGSSLLVMAIVGGAIIPVLTGAFADQLGLNYALLVPMTCYLYVYYYAVDGSKVAAKPGVHSKVVPVG